MLTSMLNPVQWRMELAESVQPLARKWLFGSLMGLYWSFIGWLGIFHPDSTVPGKTVFGNLFRYVWSAKIRFRKASQHSMCTVCWQYKRLIKSMKNSSAEKLRLTKEYSEHNQEQFRDRIMYWCLTAASRLRVEGVLVIILDAMDKSKTVYPRFAASSTNKEMANLPNRPCTSLHLALAHGFGGFAFLLDEGADHGATSFVNIIFLVLDQVRKLCIMHRWSWPTHLVLQAATIILL